MEKTYSITFDTPTELAEQQALQHFHDLGLQAAREFVAQTTQLVGMNVDIPQPYIASATYIEAVFDVPKNTRSVLFLRGFLKVDGETWIHGSMTRQIILE